MDKIAGSSQAAYRGRIRREGDTDGPNWSSQQGVDWRMKIDDARRKLKSVYPKSLL